MPCNPGDNTLNPSILGPPPILPGFGIPFSPLQLPFPDFQLPPGIPEDILALLDQLVALIPGGPFIPNPDNFMKDVLDALASLLNQIAPYLGLYRFLQALLNMILCIIDILCALTNPFKLRKALAKLFKQCLPPFLNLFPWLALLAMIIALLLLLLALIKYIIQRILDLINQILKNLEVLAEAAQLQGEEEILAATRKIAYLLCLIEQLFAILIAFQAILAIIQALANIQGRGVCTAGGTNGDCCTDDVCPPFIRNNPDGLTGTKGRLLYYNERLNDTSGLTVPLVLPPIRNESWQFVDEQTGKTYNIKDIITPVDDNIFWPDGMTFPSNTSLKKAPYLVDLTLDVNPVTFGHSDTKGLRSFKITNCIVTQRPYVGLRVFNNSFVATPNTGTVLLEGGLVFESDGTTPYEVNGQQASLNTFIHFNSGINIPPFDDGYNVFNISYTLKINHPALVQYTLITLGCMPEVSVESEIANLVASDIRAVIQKIGPLPNIGDANSGTVGCLTTALANLRKDVSPTNVSNFQNQAVACLTDLQAQTQSAYENAMIAGTSIYQSTVEIDPAIQFVNSPINVKVTLKDPGGTTISLKIPQESQATIASKIQSDTTFGTITNFAYDGYGAFIADINSSEPGSGDLTITFDNQTFSQLIGQDDLNTTTSIATNIVHYQFVGRPISIEGTEAVPRRDVGDVARDSGEGGS